MTVIGHGWTLLKTYTHIHQEHSQIRHRTELITCFSEAKLVLTSVKQRATDEERDNAQKHVSGPSQPAREPPAPSQLVILQKKYTYTHLF